jgi:hypothetical protein
LLNKYFVEKKFLTFEIWKIFKTKFKVEKKFLAEKFLQKKS